MNIKNTYKNLTFDGVGIANITLEIDGEFCEREYENQNDTGLVKVSFEIESKQFEYQEWFSVEEGTVERTDKMHPNSTSPLAEALDEYLAQLNESDNLGWDFVSELNNWIEGEIDRMGK